ncbi:hypothetical protein DTO013E5_4712 [Penicillium roqueforti]|nr:hypothetical protein CBS147337_4450 [Penicillium roqueforti]KAI2676737.1 hypothetical protein CBS147355_5839 [Penicillium roqueforti]KAI2683612.1 hypothetical protein LCP963914a_6013 [Penicillium roqueforti]KAI2725330.1 hypothetical protein CBS147354_4907 [Penicillium roqueforti]KAI2738588.1 hypothetical protein DTO012A1_6740 [Penicillium roqueforti]
MEAGMRIGIELELLLQHRTKAKSEFTDLESFADYLVQHFHAARKPHPRIHNDIDGLYDGLEDSTEWSLTDDVTIIGNSEQLELVTPILFYQAQSPWRDQLRHMFRALNLVCKISTNPTCAVHVHISPPQGNPWSLRTLKSISRHIFYFEPAILSIVPDHRRYNRYAASNYCDNSRLKGKTFRRCLALIERCTNHVEIADLLNDGGRRYFAWNLTNLYYGGKTTIEFRQALASNDEKSCLPWVEFVASFIHSFKISASDTTFPRFSRDVQGLKKFLTSFELSGVNCGILDSLFHRKSGAIEPRPMRELTVSEQKMLKVKESEGDRKNIVIKKLRSRAVGAPQGAHLQYVPYLGDPNRSLTRLGNPGAQFNSEIKNRQERQAVKSGISAIRDMPFGQASPRDPKVGTSSPLGDGTVNKDCRQPLTMALQNNEPAPLAPQSSLSFTQGLLLGQLLVVLLIGAFIKFFIFGKALPPPSWGMSNRITYRCYSLVYNPP